MDKFLKQLQLSDEAISIYFKSLGREPMTYYELYSIVPNLSPEDFTNTLNDLVTAGIIVQIISAKQEILPHYLAIPPIKPVLDYYANINANLSTIETQVQTLIKNVINDAFPEGGDLNPEEIVSKFKELKKDLDEDILIQKQDAKDLLEEMEQIDKNKEVLDNFQNEIKISTTTQFANLIQSLTDIKARIIESLEPLVLKKKEEEVIEVIEEQFKQNLQKMVNKFTSSLLEVVEGEFRVVEESFLHSFQSSNQIVNDFNMLVMNMVNHFDAKIKEMFKLIPGSKEKIEKMSQSEPGVITKKFNEIIKNSLDEVSKLNKPVEIVLAQYFNEIFSPEKVKIDNIWTVNSKTKVNEEILNLLNTSKTEVLFILPTLENHINLEQLQNISESLTVKIMASNPETDNLAKNISSLKNVEYNHFQNPNFIGLIGDNTHLVISLMQLDSQDPLNDCTGIGSNNQPLINLLAPIIHTTWSAASGTPSSAPTTTIPAPALTPTAVQVPTPSTAPKRSPTPAPAPAPASTLPALQILKTPKKKPHSRPKKAPPKRAPKKAPKVEITLTSSVEPKPGDEGGITINNAFNNLFQKLSSLSGPEFSKELQDVSDLILELRGFSVTAHKLRSVIGEYKEKKAPLNEDDINKIFQYFEEWKGKFFQ